MSYDLMVFDPADVPRHRTKFLAWYGEQTEWQESHGYNDPNVPSSSLRSWFGEIIESFPPMNGPLASNDADDPRVADYSLGRSVIYVAFAWSEAEAAYTHVKELATRHGVGFFDVSGDGGDIWWPEPKWKLTCENRGDIPLPIDLEFGDTLAELDPKKNSFFILQQDDADYVQCGGSSLACTVELRNYQSPQKYKHYVVGRANGSTAEASVKMSGGVVTVQQGEVLNAAEAAELFEHFLAGKTFPERYALRQTILM